MYAGLGFNSKLTPSLCHVCMDFFFIVSCPKGHVIHYDLSFSCFVWESLSLSFTAFYFKGFIKDFKEYDMFFVSCLNGHAVTCVLPEWTCPLLCLVWIVMAFIISSVWMHLSICPAKNGFVLYCVFFEQTHPLTCLD